MDEKTRLLDLLQGMGDIRLTNKEAKAILEMIKSGDCRFNCRKKKCK